MTVEVEAYSGYKANEKPRSFRLNERRYEVREVCDQWYGPESSYFKLRADDENLYILQYWPGREQWSLEAFRTTAASGRSLRRYHPARQRICS